MKVINNVVNEETLRNVQSKTLKELADILKRSFGPNGSNACIKKENALSRYTKDGHTIISSLAYNGMIEHSIKEDIESITRHIVKTVGDGTTSAVILSSLIFDSIINLDTKEQPATIVKVLEDIVDDIKERIKYDAKPFEASDAYDIAMISTNGNEFISKTIEEIYTEFGPGVFIDVSPAMGEETTIKSYNGMTLNTGYCDTCYVTNTKNNSAEVDNPEVYFFEHPVDTRELGVYLDAIISRNIVTPVNNKDFANLIPTVIFAPKISQDMSSIMDSLTATMASMPASNKLPICIITDYHEVSQLNDLARMCGAKMIRKYIDRGVYEEDVATGKAPTPDTIFAWAGHCDKVVAYSDKTTFIRPSAMYKEDGITYSALYNNLVEFLKSEIKKATDGGDNAREVGTLKRRLHSLESNMVELFIGGITQADRDALRDLVEDAVLNVRSAAANGVGYGANMSAAIATYQAANCYDADDRRIEAEIARAIYYAYEKIVSILFNLGDYRDDAEDMIVRAINTGEVYNLRTHEYSLNVKSSIMSDVTIIDTVCKIVGIIATCNQFILPTAGHNIYTA